MLLSFANPVVTFALVVLQMQQIVFPVQLELIELITQLLDVHAYQDISTINKLSVLNVIGDVKLATLTQLLV